MHARAFVAVAKRKSAYALGMTRISHIDTTAFTRRGEAWSEVTELAPSSFRVRLGGAFRGAWLAHLGGHLAARRISIDHIHARCESGDIWIAELHLLSIGDETDPLGIDYAALAQAESSSRAAFELTSYRLLDSRDYGGSLMLTLEAPDSLGLLGALLRSLSELGLFPVELHIETKDGRAYDSLWLAAEGRTPPSTALRAAALAVLERSLGVSA